MEIFKRLLRMLPIGALLALCIELHAQKIDVHGGFLSDSLKIGEETGFYLSARYPEHLNILFPDSTFNFAPFEIQRKKYFPTRTLQGTSHDSAIYYLTTFEVDRIQALSLPAFIVNPKDCTLLESETDSIRIVQLIPHPPDSLSAQELPLKENTAYQNVFFLFNYPVLLIVVGVLLVLTLIIFVVFGKSIRRHFKLRRLHKDHQNFQQGFTNFIRELNSTFSVSVTESAVVLWKKYMEQLNARPYTKLTTREMMLLENDEMLVKNLKVVDGAIYGHETHVVESLESLKDFADQRFSKKIEELKHG